MSLIKSDNFFVVRLPRLPQSNLDNIPEGIKELRILLKEWMADPLVKEAIYIASPTLYDRIGIWSKNPNSKEAEKISYTLLKYYVRMSSRPTPFGLFSGIGLGTYSKRNLLISDSPILDIRRTRIDIAYLLSIRESLRATVGDDALRFFLNPTLRGAHSFIYYIELTDKGGNRQYKLSSIDTEPHLIAMLTLMGYGSHTKPPKSVDDIICGFCDIYPEAKREDVKTYITELIDESVLVVDFPLPITGEPTQSGVYTSLSRLNIFPGSEIFLECISKLDKLDSVAPEQRNEKLDPLSIYKSIYNSLSKLPFPIPDKKLFQVDIRREFKACELSEDFSKKLGDTLILLAETCNPTRSSLENFVDEFNRRFSGHMVPLLTVTNEETGVSIFSNKNYKSDLLSDLKIKHKQIKRGAEPRTENFLDRLITDQYHNSLDNEKAVIVIESKDLKQEAANKANAKINLPSSFAAIVSLYKNNEDDLVVHFKGCYGPSAANLLGRFSHLDKKLCSYLQLHLRQEETNTPEAIFAEVVHLPDGRTGNIVARPHLRNYEIVVISESYLPNDRQISLDDLNVYVENGIVKLWSSRLNRQIIPRLSSAHNYNNSTLGIYKFLCMLQNQNYQLPKFIAPASLQGKSFTPRIIMDNVILQVKRWSIDRILLEKLIDNDSWQSSIWEKLSKDHHLDRYVSYAFSDNVLPIDLHNPLMVKLLLLETKGMSQISLEENLSKTLRSAVSGKCEREVYTNEVIIPFLSPKTSDSTVSQRKSAISLGFEERRYYAPGSEWASYKIYGANSSLELFLVNQIRQFLQENSAYFDTWFFIRYQDPDYHIRLRICGCHNRINAHILPAFQKLIAPWLDDNILHRVELFTYIPEIARYGGVEGIKLAETLFMHESKSVLDILHRIQGKDDSIRWRISIIIFDLILSAFGYEVSDKLNFSEKNRSAFGREFGEDKRTRSSLGAKYRKVRRHIFDDMSLATKIRNCELTREPVPKNTDGLDNEIIFLVEEYFRQLLPLGADYENLRDCDSLIGDMDSIVGSILHMFINRVFKSENRTHEFVIYDFLRRYYLSVVKHPLAIRKAT